MAEYSQRTPIDALPQHAGVLDYSVEFRDVLDCFRADPTSISEYEGAFGHERYRIVEGLDSEIALDHVRFGNEYRRYYSPVLRVTFDNPAGQRLFFVGNPEQIPRDAVATPELVLRGLLNGLRDRPYIQRAIRNRLEETVA